MVLLENDIKIFISYLIYLEILLIHTFKPDISYIYFKFNRNVINLYNLMIEFLKIQ